MPCISGVGTELVASKEESSVSMKRVLVVFGTRPEAIKMAPVVKELKKLNHLLQVDVCVTGQHRRMLDQVLNLFEIYPEHDLDVMKPGQDLFGITASVLTGMQNVIAEARPDLVLVHGDTTTTLAATLAAYYSKVPVGHVEAGLRTRDPYAPFPEEINRKVVGCIAAINFAPTEKAKHNLLAEGVPEDSVFVTGNTVIDSLFAVLDRLNTCPALAGELQRKFAFLDQEKKLVLVTGHRRENFGSGFRNLCLALRDLAERHPDLEILYPVHLNPNVQEPVWDILGEKLENVHLIDPVDYLPFVYLMNRAYLVITDSGGIQEEAPSLGKPVLVTREVTERPEAVAAGTVRLVGTERGEILKMAELLVSEPAAYQAMARSHNPYGDGNAAQKIVSVIADRLVGDS